MPRRQSSQSSEGSMTRSEGEQSRPSRRLGITGYVGLVREGYDE